MNTDSDDGALSKKVSRVLGRDADYAHSWLKTGPLIEELDIALIHATKHDQPIDEPRQWLAYRNGGSYVSSSAVDVDVRRGSWGETPLIAVCNLLVALAAAGELKIPFSP